MPRSVRRRACASPWCSWWPSTTVARCGSPVVSGVGATYRAMTTDAQSALWDVDVPVVPQAAVRVSPWPCLDCGDPVPWKPRGTPSPRCLPCRDRHKRARARARLNGTDLATEMAREPQAPLPCLDCGVPVERWSGKRGRPPTRCAPCEVTHRRAKGRAVRDPNSPEAATRVSPHPCLDCAGVVPWDGRGRWADRCPPCRSTHVRALQRAARTGRTVEDEKAVHREPFRCVGCGVELPNGRRLRCADCKPGWQRAYHRAWRYGTDPATELARERAAGCRVCGARPSHLTKDFCDGCEASGARKVYRRARRFYGLGHDDAVTVAAAVECAICARRLDRTLTSDTGAASAAHIDHDHATNQIRGVLCGACNRALGQMGDDVARMLRAVDYLTGTRAVVERDGVVVAVAFPD